ncbi:MAG: PHP domain-containing protein, partial [Corynebacterium sp.]|nr:PHP domain-containing protein [Corynebacterium sp.]
MFSNGRALSWSRLERILSGTDTAPLHAVGVGEGGRETLWRDGARTAGASCAATVPFAELHAAGSYNFLHGASDPAEYVDAAVDLGLTALAVLDRDGLYGAARLATAAAEAGLATVFGAELSVFGTDVAPLTVLCRGQDGYRRLSHVITDARMARREKDSADYPPLTDVAAAADGHWYVLLDHHHLHHATEIVGAFGPDACLVE